MKPLVKSADIMDAIQILVESHPEGVTSVKIREEFFPTSDNQTIQMHLTGLYQNGFVKRVGRIGTGPRGALTFLYLPTGKEYTPLQKRNKNPMPTESPTWPIVSTSTPRSLSKDRPGETLVAKGQPTVSEKKKRPQDKSMILMEICEACPSPIWVMEVSEEMKSVDCSYCGARYIVFKRFIHRLGPGRQLSVWRKEGPLAEMPMSE